MNKILCVLLFLAISGCASVNIPNYIKGEHPYRRTFYAGFDKVKDATLETLRDFGWVVGNESDPALFEREREAADSGREQTLFFTEVRQTPFFVGSRYARLNAYLRTTADNATEVEIRYLMITSVLFKDLRNYRNDRTIERILENVEDKLK